MKALEIVKSCPLFYELYDSEILSIVEACQVLNLEPGDVIFEKGDTGNEMFLILSGSAVVVKGGKEVAKLRKGDLFGEMVLLKENERKATIKSSNYTAVMVIRYEDIFGLYETKPTVFGLVMRNLSRILAIRLEKAGAILDDLRDQLKKAG